MKTTFFRMLLVLATIFCILPMAAQSLVFHLPDGGLSTVTLPATFTVTPSGDMLLIESDGTRVELPKERILAVTYRSAKGDVNDDMQVDVADISTIIGIMAGKTDKPSDNAPAGAEAVDLGLPSGLKWANMNVGATSPEDYGDYFAWGETTPQSSNRYYWDSYKWCKGNYDTLTKYCNNSDYGYNGFTDGKTVLDMDDDAARANWGGEWRMPTRSEFEELLNNTTNEWTTQNGVNGCQFTSKTNGNSIFLPAAGTRGGGELYYVGSNGFYWSSTPDYEDDAYVLRFSSDGAYWSDDYLGRGFGQSVRPVR